ncbi:MAG: hypothetical protein ACLQBL_15130 [Polyangiaceae bacterium]|jgi:hypothetical protein
MNVWKPIALCSIAGLIASVCMQTAKADDMCHGQHHMQAALEHLRQARAELDHAEHNKGGWRDRAIESADRALHETNAGCAFADSH